MGVQGNKKESIISKKISLTTVSGVPNSSIYMSDGKTLLRRLPLKYKQNNKLQQFASIYLLYIFHLCYYTFSLN